MTWQIIGRAQFTKDDAPRVYWGSGPIRYKADAESALAYVRDVASPLLNYSIERYRRGSWWHAQGVSA